MSIISLRLNDDEMETLDEASKIYGCGVSSMIKQIVFDKLEDEFDLAAISDYEKQKKAGTLKTKPIDQVWKELGI